MWDAAGRLKELFPANEAAEEKDGPHLIERKDVPITNP